MNDDTTITGGDIQAAETALSGGSPAPPSSTTDTPAVSASAETTPPPADSVPVEGDPTSPSTGSGEPPKERWPDILANARTKAVQEAQTQFDSQYGWAKQIQPQEFQQVVEMSRKASADPIGYLQDFIKELQSHPEHSAALRSLTGRALAQLRQTGAQPQATEPQMVNVQLEDGSIVAMPRDPASWLDHQKQQWLAQVKQEFLPVTEMVKAQQAERAAVERELQTKHFTDTTYADVVTWPGMESKETQQAVAKELAAARVDPNDISAVQLALNAAYRKVVLPNLQTASRQAVLNDINRQAAASTVNPAQTSTRAPKSMADMSIAEALQYVAAQAR